MHSVRLTQDQGNEFLEMRNLSGNDTDVFYHRELQRECNERASFSRGFLDKKLGGGGNSTYYVMGTCHFARKIGTHNSVNSGGF